MTGVGRDRGHSRHASVASGQTGAVRVSSIRRRRRARITRHARVTPGPLVVGAVAVLIVSLITGCQGANNSYDQNVRRFFRRAHALNLRLPPDHVARANLMNRNPCSYNVDLSDQLRADPSYFSNRTSGLSTTDALLATALEVAVFCSGRYNELRSFVRETRTPIPSKRCMLRRCSDVSIA